MQPGAYNPYSPAPGAGSPPPQQPPAGGYPPQGQQYPPQGQGQGYPPQGQQGYPPQGQQYPPQGQGQPGYPPEQLAQPPQYGQGPPQQAVYALQPTLGFGAPPPGLPQPPPQFLRMWYAVYYSQIAPSQFPSLRQWFDSVDKDHSGQISQKELMYMPMPGSSMHVHAASGSGSADKVLGGEVAGRVIELFGVRRMEIDFFEYAAFFQFLKVLETAFVSQDRSRTGKLDQAQTALVLHQVSLDLPSHTLQMYWQQRVKGAAAGMELAGVLNLALDLIEFRNGFTRLDTDHDGRLTYDEAMQLVAQAQRPTAACVLC